MKNKKIIVIILIILFVTSIPIVINKINDNKNIALIKKEIPQVIDKKIEDVYNSKDAKEYGISNINYEITNIYKQENAGITQYTIDITISCNANDNLSETEKSLVAYAIENIVSEIDSINNYKISNGTRVSVRNGKAPYNQTITSIVNGEKIQRETTTTNTNSKSNEAGREQDAWNCATDVVKNKLYRYSNVSVSSYRNSTVSYTSSTEIYTIKGTVSYNNEYGAKVNSKFTVNLQLTERGYKNSSVLIY